MLTINTLLETEKGTEPFGIFIVADGMGGFHDGELASAIAARTAGEHIMQKLFLPGLVEQAPPKINDLLVEAVHLANQNVIKQTHMAGTTLTLAVVLGKMAHLAHVGDSRAYYYHQNTLNQLTRDHSVAARMVETGQITAEEAQNHPQQNVLYRALGQTDDFEVETISLNLAENSLLLLCSDGLWGMVPEKELTHSIANHTTPTKLVNDVVFAANTHGGHDNISVIVVKLERL
jgi:protein phosphatase